LGIVQETGGAARCLAPFLHGREPPGLAPIVPEKSGGYRSVDERLAPISVPSLLVSFLLQCSLLLRLERRPRMHCARAVQGSDDLPQVRIGVGQEAFGAGAEVIQARLAVRGS
jgi:hypothetical protein